MEPARDENGNPVFYGDSGYKPVLEGREEHVYQCFLIGIRDPGIVEQLWKMKSGAARASGA